MNYIDKYKEWVENPYFDDDVRKELESIKDNEKEIEDRFYKDLEFGTAGLRGVIEYGTNRINKYTVRRTTYGLAKYILGKNIKNAEKGVAIAHDNRHKSREFCIEAARTLSACGIKVYIFEGMRTTPELSFAVRYLGCSAGIVITASHNPPEYNGYKVYGSDGAQLMPEEALKVTEEIEKISNYSDIPYDINSENIEILSENQDCEFIEVVKNQMIRKDIFENIKDDFGVVYTPLCGTGLNPVKRALNESGFKNIIVVPEEEKPDPDFSGIEYPNPEDGKALKRGIELAKSEKAGLVIATDPDCDRVGTAIRDKNGEYVLLTGNQVGALLTDYIISSKKEKGDFPKKSVLIKSIVTSEFAAKIAEENNVEVINVLTGFKFIGEKMNSIEKSSEEEFLFGYEESYGYLVGTHARDKDAVVTSLLIVEMAAYYSIKGMTLVDVLEELYKKYGYYKEKNISLTLKGKDGVEKIGEIMEYFRKYLPESISGKKVSLVEDFKKGVVGYPKSDVIKYVLDDGSWMAIRPSGTEPKIKFYIAMSDKNECNVQVCIDNAEKYINETVAKII